MAAVEGPGGNPGPFERYEKGTGDVEAGLVRAVAFLLEVFDPKLSKDEADFRAGRGIPAAVTFLVFKKVSNPWLIVHLNTMESTTRSFMV